MARILPILAQKLPNGSHGNWMLCGGQGKMNGESRPVHRRILEFALRWLGGAWCLLVSGPVSAEILIRGLSLT